ncbi:hypothetical protein ACN4EK_00905 [Pantanalinema rosaneae CENA516]|uniref:hypothetical protein n=1 Tax=Pantanalinema rosaneae TaxID=1620701 RepID=UPI003D6DFE0B
MEPLLISEDYVCFFKFWLDGQIQAGMRWEHKLFRHCRTFDKSHRQQVYSLAWALMEHQMQVVITASKTTYQVWISLDSQPTLCIEEHPPGETADPDHANVHSPSEMVPYPT